MKISAFHTLECHEGNYSAPSYMRTLVEDEECREPLRQDEYESEDWASSQTESLLL